MRVTRPRPSRKVSNDRLLQMIDELSEEAVFDRLSSIDKGMVEGVGDHLRTVGKVSPLQAGAIIRIYERNHV